MRPILHDQEQRADCHCDSGNRFDVQYYHAGVSERNPRGRPNSTGSDIGDLEQWHTLALVRISHKSSSYMSCGHNLIPFRRGYCIEGKA